MSQSENKTLNRKTKRGKKKKRNESERIIKLESSELKKFIFSPYLALYSEI